MNIVLLLVLVVWSIRIFANVLSYVHLWFVKEYRFDRMLIHLGTPQGRQIFFPSFRLPRISPKTIVIFTGSGVIFVFLFLFLPIHVLLRFLVIDVVTFPITGILVGLLQAPTFLYHRFLIVRAIRLLRDHKPMAVIGITGSFGKTSTKEYMATILSGTYRVLKTEASKNSPIGIAETVLKHLTPDVQVFIVEMGAYKRGEIRAMADMVRPQIGIITAVNAQHQDLFATLENTMRAKYELIQGLQGKKIAIINADNPFTRHMGEWARRDGLPVWWYTARDGTELEGVLLEAREIEADEKGVTARIVYGKRAYRLSANVLGEHQVGNISAAIAGAVAVGMDIRDAVKGASRVKPYPKTMEPAKGVHEATFINDTFNNNPDAALAAIDFLAKTKGRKILVFQPMVELGAHAVESHKDVGRKASQICDDILLTNENYYESIVAGATEVGKEKKVRVLSARESASYIDKTVKKGDTVLFKGKEAERVFRLCFSQ